MGTHSLHQAICMNINDKLIIMIIIMTSGVFTCLYFFSSEYTLKSHFSIFKWYGGIVADRKGINWLDIGVTVHMRGDKHKLIFRFQRARDRIPHTLTRKTPNKWLRELIVISFTDVRIYACILFQQRSKTFQDGSYWNSGGKVVIIGRGPMENILVYLIHEHMCTHMYLCDFTSQTPDSVDPQDLPWCHASSSSLV